MTPNLNELENRSELNILTKSADYIDELRAENIKLIEICRQKGISIPPELIYSGPKTMVVISQNKELNDVDDLMLLKLEMVDGHSHVSNISEELINILLLLLLYDYLLYLLIFSMCLYFQNNCIFMILTFVVIHGVYW